MMLAKISYLELPRKIRSRRWTERAGYWAFEGLMDGRDTKLIANGVRFDPHSEV